MTAPSTSVVLHTRAGGRSLLRAADSLARQRTTGVELLIAVFGPPPHNLVDSTSLRLAAAVMRGASRPAAINQAALAAGGEQLVLLPEAYRLVPRALDRALAIARESGTDAVATPILIRTPDGTASSCWIPTALDAVSALADPRGMPPLVVVQRSVWRDLGGLDESLTELAEYDFWLRLLLAGYRVALASEPLAARDVGADGSDGAAGSNLAEFWAVIEKHRQAVEGSMIGVLAAREIHFGTLRGQHADLVRSRDAGVAELDRLRTEIAHRRAFLEHHGRQGIDWGDWRRLDPVSRDWGYDRGVPVDRRHIEDFLAAHSSDIRGAVLEVQEADYTRQFGEGRVAGSDVLDVDPANPRATIVADLRAAPELASDRFDCVILTQTLHVVDDMEAALCECYRVLAPGGVLLATMPAASRVCLEYGEDGDFWRATPAGARAVVERTFGAPVDASAYGNVLTNVAFLEGISSGELTDAELDAADPYFPALTGIRARKGGPSDRPHRGLVLLYHRLDDRVDVHDLAVPPDLFGAHLEWLTSTCELLPLDEILGRDPDSLPARAIALTFDDGYVDTLGGGAPVLQRHRVPSTFFLTTRWLHERGEYWWDVLERALLAGVETPARFEPHLDGLPAVLATSTAAERAAAHALLHPALVHASLAVRDRFMAALVAWSGGAAAGARPMSAAEVRELSAIPGVSIGSHTVNHLALPDQPEAVRRIEVADCAVQLSDVIGRPVENLAYPYGAVDRASASLARQTCRWSVTCDASAVPESFDAARVPRLDVKRWPVAELASRVEQAFAPSARRRAFSLPR